MHGNAPGEPPSHGGLGPDPGHGGPAEADASAHPLEPGGAVAGAGGGSGAQSAEAAEPHTEGGYAGFESSRESHESSAEAAASQGMAGEPEKGAVRAARDRGYGAPAGLPHVQGGTPGHSDGGDEAAAPSGTSLFCTQKGSIWVGHRRLIREVLLTCQANTGSARASATLEKKPCP